MRRMRVGIGLMAWLAAGVVLSWWLKGYVLSPQAAGHRVATDLWQFASAERRIVALQFDECWPVEVGDPIYRVDGPNAIEQVGEIRRVFPPAVRRSRRRRRARRPKRCFIPTPSRICVESQLTYYTTPTSLAWVLETMLPPQRRIEIAQEIAATYEAYHAEIVQALKPVIIGGLVDATQVVEEDLAAAVSRRREQLERLASRYQDHVVDQELVPLIREQIWPIVQKHAEPLANEIGEEMFQRAQSGDSVGDWCMTSCR